MEQNVAYHIHIHRAKDCKSDLIEAKECLLSRIFCRAALVEALMGFQFNHVGGGTKTRRPITLHMKYNSACVQPNCYLLTEDFGEQEVSLEELQVGQLCRGLWGTHTS